MIAPRSSAERAAPAIAQDAHQLASSTRASRISKPAVGATGWRLTAVVGHFDGFCAVVRRGDSSTIGTLEYQHGVPDDRSVIVINSGNG